MLGRKGANHPGWKGGRLVIGGYVHVLAPNHPWPRGKGYVQEHVMVMESALGRRLGPNEVVHHKDHDRTNNALANLELMTSGQHSSHHNRETDFSQRKRRNGRFA